APRLHPRGARRDAGASGARRRRRVGELGRRRARRRLARHPALSQVKKRLDVLLVERGLAESRAQAQALVLAGRVPGYAKAGAQVEEETELSVTAPPRFVSRGGEKLAHALEALGGDVAGLGCLD